MNCLNCSHEFEENEGRYHHSDGTLCTKCEDNIKDINLVTDETLFENNSNISFSENQELEKYGVDGNLLAKYARVTSNLKFFTTIAIGKPDMFIIGNIIKEKEVILKDLFANVNLSYNLDDMDSTAQEFLELVNEWAKTTIKCVAN